MAKKLIAKPVLSSVKETGDKRFSLDEELIEVMEPYRNRYKGLVKSLTEKKGDGR